MIEMQLVGLRIELPTNQPIVLLKELQGERYLPIWVGQVEAEAIAAGMRGIEPARPQTHDLMRDLFVSFGVELQHILITELKDRTFFAELHAVRDGNKTVVSSRPSDSIALASRLGVPIFCADEVLEEASIMVKDEEVEDQEKTVGEFREFLDQINPEDFAN